MILEILSGDGKGMKAEVQIRTVALDYWADLEHQLQYKRQKGSEKPPAADLKRCADDLVLADLSVQTIRNLIVKNFEKGSCDPIVHYPVR